MSSLHSYPPSELSFRILDLPSEIIQIIFVHSLPDVTFVKPIHTKAPLSLTVVCRTFRQIALTTPGLWCSFDFTHLHVDYICSLLEEIEQWFIRAQDAPLQLFMSQKMWHCSRAATIFDDLVSRCSHLCISLDKEYHPADIFLASTQTFNLNRLKELELVFCQTTDCEAVATASSMSPLLRLGSGKLRALTMPARLRKDIKHVDWSRLTALAFPSGNRWGYTPAESVIGFVRLLHDVRMLYMPVPPDAKGLNDIIPLPFLEEITLYVDYKRHSTWSQCLPHLDAPLLRSLKIAVPYPERSFSYTGEMSHELSSSTFKSWFQDLVERSDCKLAALDLHHVRMECSDLRVVLREAGSSLTQLTLHGTYAVSDRILASFGYTSPLGRCIFPKLEYLSLSDDNAQSDSALANAIRSRLRPEAKISGVLALKWVCMKREHSQFPAFEKLSEAGRVKWIQCNHSYHCDPTRKVMKDVATREERREERDDEGEDEDRYSNGRSGGWWFLCM